MAKPFSMSLRVATTIVIKSPSNPKQLNLTTGQSLIILKEEVIENNVWYWCVSTKGLIGKVLATDVVIENSGVVYEAVEEISADNLQDVSTKHVNLSLNKGEKVYVIDQTGDLWHCANERGATGVVDKRHLKLCSDMNAASDDRNQAAPFHFKIECFRERQWRAVGEFQCNSDATVRSLLTQIMQHDASLTTKLSLCALYWPEKNKFLQPIAPLRNYAMRRDTLVRLKLFDFYAHFAKLNSGPTRKPTNNNKNNNNNNTNNNNNIIINNNNNSINNTDVAKPITTPSHIPFVPLPTKAAPLPPKKPDQDSDTNNASLSATSSSANATTSLLTNAPTAMLNQSPAVTATRSTSPPPPPPPNTVQTQSTPLSKAEFDQAPKRAAPMLSTVIEPITPALVAATVSRGRRTSNTHKASRRRSHSPTSASDMAAKAARRALSPERRRHRRNASGDAAHDEQVDDNNDTSAGSGDGDGHKARTTARRRHGGRAHRAVSPSRRALSPTGRALSPTRRALSPTGRRRRGRADHMSPRDLIDAESAQAAAELAAMLAEHGLTTTDEEGVDEDDDEDGDDDDDGRLRASLDVASVVRSPSSLRSSPFRVHKTEPRRASHGNEPASVVDQIVSNAVNNERRTNSDEGGQSSLKSNLGVVPKLLLRATSASKSQEASHTGNTEQTHKAPGLVIKRDPADILVSPRNNAYATVARSSFASASNNNSNSSSTTTANNHSATVARKQRSQTVMFGAHNFHFAIPQHATVKSTTGGKPFTAFVLEFVASRGHKCKVLKRYSEFADLHAELASLFPTITLPKLPGRKLINNFDSNFLQRRQTKLCAMMTALSEIAAVATSSTFLGFLQDSLQMSPSDWDELFAGVDDEQHEKHAILVQEDEPSEALYYIVSGMVTVERGSLQLKLLAPGDWFGEFSVLLGQATATASIVAQKSVVVRRLSRAALLKRIWATPTLGSRLLITIILKLSDSARALPLTRAAAPLLAKSRPSNDSKSGGNDDAESRAVRTRAEFQRRFHLSSHDTILHKFECSHRKNNRVYQGDLFISQRCIAFFSKLFGDEFQIKCWFKSLAGVNVSDVDRLSFVDRASGAGALYVFALGSSDAAQAAKRAIDARMSACDAAPATATTASPTIAKRRSSWSAQAPPGTSFVPHAAVAGGATASSSRTGTHLIGNARRASQVVMADMHLTPTQWSEILAHGRMRSFKAGQVVYKQGQSVRSLFQVAGGELRAEHEVSDDRPPVVVGRISAGDIVGELSYLIGGGAPDTVIAETDAHLYEIEFDRVAMFFSHHRDLEIKFLHALAVGLVRRQVLRESEVMHAAQLSHMQPHHYFVRFYFRRSLIKGGVDDARSDDNDDGDDISSLSDDEAIPLPPPDGEEPPPPPPPSSSADAPPHTDTQSSTIGAKLSPVKRYEYIYKVLPQYNLGTFQKKLRDDLVDNESSRFGLLTADQIEFLTDNKNDLDSSQVKPEKLFIQIASVQRVRGSRCAFISDFGTTKDSEHISKQRKRRVTHLIAPNAEAFTSHTVVVKSTEHVLSPIENSIEMMRDRVQKLNDELAYDPPRINALQQVIQGSVIAMVNQGPTAIAEAFLSDNGAPDALTGANDQLRGQLREVMSEFLDCCATAVDLNRSIISEKYVKFQEMVEQHLVKLQRQLKPYLWSKPSFI